MQALKGKTNADYNYNHCYYYNHDYYYYFFYYFLQCRPPLE